MKKAKVFFEINEEGFRTFDEGNIKKIVLNELDLNELKDKMFISFLEDVKLDIFKDPSGKTYGFKIIKNGEEFLYSDGYNSKEDIIKEIEDYKTVFMSLNI